MEINQITVVMEIIAVVVIIINSMIIWIIIQLQL